MKLLHATSAALFVRDDRAGGARLIAVASVDTLTPRRLTLLQRIPNDFPWPRAGMIVENAADTLMLPADDMNHPLGNELAAQNASALYMALRYDDELIGAMSALRPGSSPFGEGDRPFARAMADQVTLALTAVHVV